LKLTTKTEKHSTVIFHEAQQSATVETINLLTLTVQIWTVTHDSATLTVCSDGACTVLNVNCFFF